MASKDHQTKLFYTNSDNGIWIECTDCSWETWVDFSPSVERLNVVVEAHRKDPKAPGKRPTWD